MISHHKNPLVIIIVSLALLTAVAAGAAYYFYTRLGDQSWRAIQFKQDGAANSPGEVRDLVARVGELIVLPEDEVPTIATVTDPALLKDQPFFARAKAGFKVLIYPKARKAILYDPENHKIVEVAPAGFKQNE